MRQKSKNNCIFAPMNQSEQLILITDLLKSKFETSFSVSDTNKGFEILPENIEEFKNNLNIQDDNEYLSKIDEIEKAVNLIFI